MMADISNHTDTIVAAIYEQYKKRGDYILFTLSKK